MSPSAMIPLLVWIFGKPNPVCRAARDEKKLLQALAVSKLGLGTAPWARSSSRCDPFSVAPLTSFAQDRRHERAFSFPGSVDGCPPCNPCTAYHGYAAQISGSITSPKLSCPHLGNAMLNCAPLSSAQSRVLSYVTAVELNDWCWLAPSSRPRTPFRPHLACWQPANDSKTRSASSLMVAETMDQARTRSQHPFLHGNWHWRR